MGIFGLFGKKKEYEVAEIYLNLRNQVLDLAQNNTSSLLDPTSPLIGVLMETGYDEAVVTLVTIADGTVSLYFSNGGAMIGLGEHEEPRKACVDFLSFAIQFLSQAVPVSKYPLPLKGQTLFYFLTSTGILSAEGKENDLGNRLSPLSPLFFKAHEVISQARMMEEKIQRNIKEFIEYAAAGNESAIKDLISARRNPDLSDPSGRTPLMAGAYNGHSNVVKLLLDNNATIDQKDASGYTALMFACNAGKFGCAQLLIERGANVQEEANDGSTPIMFSAQYGHNDIVRLLLTHGADPLKKGEHGLSAVGFAQQNNLAETERILSRRE